MSASPTEGREDMDKATDCREEFISQLSIHFDNEYAKLYALAYHYVGQEAKDILQESFLRLATLSRDKQELINNIRPYLYTLVKNTSINYSKKSKRTSFVSDTEEIAGLQITKIVEKIDYILDLPTILKLLTEKQAEAFQLYLEGYPHKDIKEKMGLKSENAAKNLVLRARERLRDKLLYLFNIEPNGDDDGSGGAIAMPVPNDNGGYRCISLSELSIDLIENYIKDRLLPLQRQMVEWVMLFDDIAFNVIQGMKKYMKDTGSEVARVPFRIIVSNMYKNNKPLQVYTYGLN